jgi:hypothetical protein
MKPALSAVAEEAQRHWWGTFEVPVDQALHWRIGPLDLWLKRLPCEWRIAYQTAEDPRDPNLLVAQPFREEDFEEGISVLRVAGATEQQVRLSPTLGDRPIVVRPKMPFELPANRQVSVFGSLPVWVRVSLPPSDEVLLEVPTVRLSKTWLGPNTLEGEICYAAQLSPRLRLEHLPPLPHRALAKVDLHNRAADTLKLERLSLPAPDLQLFAAADHRLWVQNIRVIRGHDGEKAELILLPSAPEEANEARALEPASPHRSRNFLVRAWSSLWR